MIFSVYLITNADNKKKYIGVTSKNPIHRWNSHAANKSGCGAICAAIQKYGKENFIFDIIDQSAKSKDEMFLLEQNYIKQYDTYGPNGYNLTPGGEGSRGHKVSEEARQKIKDARARQIFTEETRLKLQQSGYKETESYHKRFTNETRSKLSASQKDRMKNGYNPKATKWIVKTNKDEIQEILNPTSHFGKSFKSFWTSKKLLKPISKGEYAGWQLIEIVKI